MGMEFDRLRADVAVIFQDTQDFLAIAARLGASDDEIKSWESDPDKRDCIATGVCPDTIAIRISGMVSIADKYGVCTEQRIEAFMARQRILSRSLVQNQSQPAPKA